MEKLVSNCVCINHIYPMNFGCGRVSKKLGPPSSFSFGLVFDFCRLKKPSPVGIIREKSPMCENVLVPFLGKTCI